MNSNTLQQAQRFDTQKRVKVVLAKGDGIGPEIMNATLRILDAAGANIEPEYIEVGEKAYLSGNTSGIHQDAWDAIHRNKIILKAPITTPQGKGYKSLNVTLRKSLGLFANVRPVASLHPFVKTHFPEMDVVIIRENEEDLYAGIEHRQTQDVIQCLKLITRPGCERIIRYAFEYAKAYGRKKVTCMVKDNIMKLTDGLFHKVFDEIAAEYPEIQKDTQIIDIGSARLAARPQDYDVIVTSNLYGDIISDIAAEIAGSVGLAGSANIGKNVAMFEAIHGSAPDIAGQGVANPLATIMSAAMSSLRSTVNSLSSVSVEDFFNRGKKKLEGAAYMRISKYAVVFWGVVCIAFSFLFGGNKNTVIEIINAIGSVFYGPVLVTFILAIFSKRVNHIGMNAGIISAVLINLMFSSTIQGIFGFDLGIEIFWIWLNFTGVLISLVVAYVVSYLTPAIPIKKGETIAFKVKRSDIFSKEVYILVAYFVLILIVSYFVPQIFA